MKNTSNTMTDEIKKCLDLNERMARQCIQNFFRVSDSVPWIGWHTVWSQIDVIIEFMFVTHKSYLILPVR